MKNKDIIIKALQDKYNVIIDNNKQNITLSSNIFLQIEQEFIWPDLNNQYYNIKGSCLGCRDHIGILVDGTIVPCCLDSKGTIKLGNIYHDELSDIITSKLFQELKKGFENNQKSHPLCRHCNFYDIKKNIHNNSGKLFKTF